MQLNAKRVVLELLSATGKAPAPAAALVQACGLFGISENSTRVTLTRLLAAGTIDATGRGEYRLGGPTAALTSEVTAWRDLEQQIRRWTGGYVGVATGGLGTRDRAQQRRRARALRLLGFAPLVDGLEVRPDNLAGGVDAVRLRLRALGLDGAAPVLRLTDLDGDDDARARQLWDGAALAAGYRAMRSRLERWLERGPGQAVEAAARESFLLGSEAIHLLVFDPRLPEPLVDVDARRALVDATRRFDSAGRRIWERLFGVAHARAAQSQELH